ncbi:MAG: sensory transduction histidine kinase [Clostridiaceae bacterium]|nr:sensory transduction histidine kinase [Clostridiaceae bacterium]
MRIKKSITVKLFLITTVVFIAFLSTTLIVQSVFFEKFYISKKKSNLHDNLIKFMTDYNKTNDLTKTTELIKEFEENNSAKVVILDSYGQLKFITKSGNEKSDAGKIRIVNEIIRQLNINANTFNNIQNNVRTIITDTKEFETKNVVCFSPDSTKNEFVFVISSLQPINEAAIVIKEFYLYFYAGAVLLIVILSFVYSNMISKPLIKINSTASKMAKLDFSEHCDINSEDEIGNLASSLNFLSENLNNALSSLREANTKLENDIEHERTLEKMRKEFTASVSHELKTPISLIDGYAEALKDNVVVDEDRDYYLDVIIDESRRMNNLVSDMLDLSQLESGNFKLIKEEFNIDELISQIVRKFFTMISQKNIDLRVSLIKGQKVNADWDRIEQVLNNLLTNAIRHVDDNGFIKIEMKKDEQWVTVEVENSGKHISEEEQGRIWDNFYKVDKSRNRKLGGTGIGLAIVKNILKLHESEYGVNNTEKGVMFYFKLKSI